MTEIDTEIVVATETVCDELLQELASLYVDEPHKPVIWSWQFKSRFDRPVLAVTARRSGRLIGFNGTMPVKVGFGDSITDAFWSCDFIVAEQYRRTGIGSKLKDEMNRSLSAPIMSLGISDSALPVLQKKGWQEAGDAPLSKRVFRPYNCKEGILWLLGLIQTLNAGTPAIFSKKLDIRFYRFAELPKKEIVDSLWAKYRPVNQYSVIKNYEYLKWRYDDYPIDTYRYILAFDAEQTPLFLVIYRVSGEFSLEIVDYIGPTDNRKIFLELFKQLRDIEPYSCKAVTWRTSSGELLKQLTRCGFIARKYATRFLVRWPEVMVQDRSWALSAGDSDGDFLKVAKDKLVSATGRFEIVRVEESEFERSRDQWNSLLTRSGANDLFMSWEWQYEWWKTWGQKSDRYEFFCHYVLRDGELMGILPLFRLKKQRNLLRELHFIGNAWRVEPTIRSEYISPIFCENSEDELRRFFFKWLKHIGCNVCVISPDSCSNYISGYSHYAVVRQVDIGHRISTQGSMADYLNGLGAQTRLKAFNRLNYIEKSYSSIEWGEYSSDEEGVSNFFHILNKFHRDRWGSPCFNEHALRFHFRLIEDSCRSSFAPLLHYLKIDNEVVSVSYNIIVGRTVYNLQSGYAEGFDKKVSLGTLHFGKLIQIFFESKEIDYFDLLAGSGKNTDYKRSFKGSLVSFPTLQIFSRPSLAYLYRSFQKIMPVIHWIRGRSL